MRFKIILLVLLLITLSVVFGACSANNDELQQDDIQTQGQTPGEDASGQTPESTPTQTPVKTQTPDFSDVDLTGKWHVAQIIDSNGEAVSESEMKSLSPDFILELLENDMYFVYDKDGETLGQGGYSIELNQLTLTAAEQQTVYEVRDKDTLWCVSPDKSVTVMTRVSDEPEEPDNTEDTENSDGENNSEGESNTDGETDENNSDG